MGGHEIVERFHFTLQQIIERLIRQTIKLIFIINIKVIVVL